MSLKDLAWDVGALAAALAVGIGLGYVRGDRAGTADMLGKVTAAQNAQARAEGQARNSDTALRQITDRLDAQKADAERLRRLAEIALDQRDAARAQLDKLTKQRIAAVEKLAHEDRDCRALDRLPVCPAIAQRLFRQGGATSAAPVRDRSAAAGISAGASPAH